MEQDAAAKKKKIPSGSIKLQMAGDLMFARNSNRDLAQVFRRYEALLESFANMEREERILNYKFFIALILTSHAKKTKSTEEKKRLFDLKNELYFNIANNRKNRRKLAFRYLNSKNFRVLEFCSKCNEENSKSELPRHKWKFCKDCNVDRKFYNVLQMTHHFDNGTVSLFLSNDLVDKVEGLKLTHKGKLDDQKEEGRFDKFHYNVRNLDVFDIASVEAAQKKLLKA